MQTVAGRAVLHAPSRRGPASGHRPAVGLQGTVRDRRPRAACTPHESSAAFAIEGDEGLFLGEAGLVVDHRWTSTAWPSAGSTDDVLVGRDPGGRDVGAPEDRAGCGVDPFREECVAAAVDGASSRSRGTAPLHAVSAGASISRRLASCRFRHPRYHDFRPAAGAPARGTQAEARGRGGAAPDRCESDMYLAARTGCSPAATSQRTDRAAAARNARLRPRRRVRHDARPDAIFGPLSARSAAAGRRRVSWRRAAVGTGRTAANSCASSSSSAVAVSLAGSAPDGAAPGGPPPPARARRDQPEAVAADVGIGGRGGPADGDPDDPRRHRPHRGPLAGGALIEAAGREARVLGAGRRPLLVTVGVLLGIPDALPRERRTHGGAGPSRRGPARGGGRPGVCR